MVEIAIEDDSQLEEPGITSNINLEETQATDKETPKEKEEPKEMNWEDDQNIYKKRFGDSTREVNEVLLPKIKEAEGLTAQEKARADKLQQERDEALGRLKDEMPETYDNLTLKKTLDENTRQLAELKEKAMLDDFVSAEPIAKDYREALKAHARAFPQKPLADIWNISFKDVAEARKAEVEAKSTRKKESQPDKGGSTRELGESTIGGYTEEEFNKLPLAKRGEILDKLNR